MTNVLTNKFFESRSNDLFSLPGLLAALVRDEVDSLTGLRPHQLPAWHMFTVQLAVLALVAGGRADVPETEEEWLGLLRGLTPDYPDDEPWRLIVDDWSRPAFMQPPVPQGLALKGTVFTPDALDLLITSKNHDVKQAMARGATAQDWVFALVSLQTGEGYGGAGNHSIARMNGGSSSRAMLGRVPLASSSGRGQLPRPGPWFRRDVEIVQQERVRLLEEDAFGFAANGGVGLTWLAAWPEGAQLALSDLDPVFIDVCRRVRLTENDGRIAARKGTSAAARIMAKDAKGNLGDPWAPIHKAEAKSLTLGDGDFDYKRMAELLAGADWTLPVAARHRKGDGPVGLFAAALARGNSRTDGYRQRIIPLRADIAELVDARPQDVGKAARALIDVAAEFRKALRGALALAAAGGEGEDRKKGHYRFADVATTQLDRFVDERFFASLWDYLAASVAMDAAAEDKARGAFVAALWDETLRAFDAALPNVPCKSLLRPRAEANARGLLRGSVMKRFGDDLKTPAHAEVRDAV